MAQRLESTRQDLVVLALVFSLLVSMPLIARSAEADRSSLIEADMVLSELNHLADELEKQRKFSRILLEKIDVMQDRIDQLEARTSDPSKKPPHVIEEHKRPSNDRGEVSKGETTDKEKEAEGKSDQNQSEKSFSDDFDHFLDMGEAMLRRFFGVVKEFRKEFEDNRA